MQFLAVCGRDWLPEAFALFRYGFGGWGVRRREVRHRKNEEGISRDGMELVPGPTKELASIARPRQKSAPSESRLKTLNDFMISWR